MKAKLEALKAAQSNQRSEPSELDSYRWKPEPGKQIIRILPNVHQKEFPFVELSFYYIFGRTMLAPSTFGKPDPVVEYCNALLDPGAKIPKDEWKLINDLKKKLLPKARTYVPILVRGKEHEGVKFWGFGQRVYTALVELAADDDYGSIEDIKTGTDLTVEYTPAPNPMDSTTSILPKRNTSIATDDTEVLGKIKEMPDLIKMFYEPSYEELKTALEKYLKGSNPETGNDEGKPKESMTNVRANTSNDDFPSAKDVKIPSGPKETIESKVDTSDIEAAFEELMKK